MPRSLKSARLWTAVAVVLLVAGAVSAMGGGMPETAGLAVSRSTAI